MGKAPEAAYCRALASFAENCGWGLRTRPGVSSQSVFMSVCVLLSLRSRTRSFHLHTRSPYHPGHTASPFEPWTSFTVCCPRFTLAFKSRLSPPIFLSCPETRHESRYLKMSPLYVKLAIAVEALIHRLCGSVGHRGLLHLSVICPPYIAPATCKVSALGTLGYRVHERSRSMDYSCIIRQRQSRHCP